MRGFNVVGWYIRNIYTKLHVGVSALLLLGTAQVAIETVDGATRLVATPRSWLTTALVAGEATWLTYVAIEVLVIVVPPRAVRYTSTRQL